MLIDARGLVCPLPVVNTRAAIEDLKSSEEVRVLVDNDIAVQNLLRFAAAKNFEAKSERLSDNNFEVTIRVIIGDENENETNEELTCTFEMGNSVVVVISSKHMGTGDEKLGEKLMKSFLFALSKQDKLPDTVILYNSGAFLSCEGSESLDDLKQLEVEGVTILTCGTCLDFYGIKDNLAVGEVTNMFEIVEKQEKADLVIRP